MPQIKAQEKSPEKELNEIEASNLPDIDFKTMIIRMLKELSEHFNKEIASIKKEIELIKKNQSEMKNTIPEMKTTLEGINSRLDEAEDQIRNLEDKVAENSQSSKKKK